MKSYPDYELSSTDAELLSAYLDDMLDDAARLALEKRLENEPGLRHELTALRQITTLINDLPELTAPRDFILTAEMLQNNDPIAEEPPALKVLPRKRKRRQNILPLMSAAAAVFVVAFGLFALFMNNMDAPTTMSEAVALAGTEDLRIREGGQLQNMLVDVLTEEPDEIAQTTEETVQMTVMSREADGVDGDTPMAVVPEEASDIDFQAQQPESEVMSTIIPSPEANNAATGVQPALAIPAPENSPSVSPTVAMGYINPTMQPVQEESAEEDTTGLFMAEPDEVDDNEQNLNAAQDSADDSVNDMENTEIDEDRGATDTDLITGTIGESTAEEEPLPADAPPEPPGMAGESSSEAVMMDEAESDALFDDAPELTEEPDIVEADAPEEDRTQMKIDISELSNSLLGTLQRIVTDFMAAFE